MSLGERIRDRRMELGISQRELAERLDVEQPMVCYIERDTKYPTLLLGWKIAKALGCTVEYLLGVEES